MDDSQGSDVFSESVEVFSDSSVNMEQDTYDSFIASTKSALSRKHKNDISFCKHFAALLDNCNMSISKSLDMIIDLLSESNIQLQSLINYLTNVIEILQMLSNYIKNLVESIPLACHNLKTFPTMTGRILITVFTHCKDSELAYGSYLGAVEKQLKDLFRMCHELQLIYLMVLEKHFVFDFSEKEEHNIFIEALEINLQIGEIVHKLDVKTMAEQWKAFTAICEKYSTNLYDKNIFYNSTKILCGMIENNVNNVVEMHEDEKVFTRSLKVTSFTIKILLKVCTVFQNDTKRYEHIFDLFIFIFLNSAPYMELVGKSPSFITLMNANVTGPMECLLKALLTDEKFLNCFTTYNVSHITKKDDLLGFILLMVAFMKTEIQMNAENTISYIKTDLVESVFKILPSCHIWFNIGLKFRFEPYVGENKTFGLNEYLLINTAALICTMNNKEYNLVEECMTNAILNTDCTSAMFSANLWTLLSRFTPSEVLVTQILTLCSFYKQLESHISFENCPQRVHLINTIRKLFHTMDNEEKLKMFKILPLNKNLNIWSVMELNGSQEQIERAKESVLNDGLKLSSLEEVVDFINLMNLASSLQYHHNNLLEDTVHVWLKLCPEDNIILGQTFEAGMLLCIHFLEALSSLSISIADELCNRHVELVKVIHVISKLTSINCLELKLVLMNLLCKICTSKVYTGNNTIECFIIESFKNIIQNNESIVINKFLSILNENIDHMNLNKIVSKAIEDCDLKQRLLEMKNRNSSIDYPTEKIFLEAASHLEFSHKCFKVDIEQVDMNKDKQTSNFDLLDLNNLFGSESDTEPQCKRVKLNVNEIAIVIEKLEDNVSQLYKVKENITSEDKLKVKELCNRLENIVD